MSLSIVLDIGGTAIKSALFQDGKLHDVRETPTNASRGGEHVMQTAEEILSSYLAQAQADAIGISTAGQVDPVKGQIIFANENIPGYTGMPVKNRMEQRFHLPVSVENDVNAAAFGESVYGAGRDETDFICLTYGTGVGGAVFAGGSLYYGSSYSAGEFGALLIHPEDRDVSTDYYSGCYEKYASASALVRRAGEIDPAITGGRQIFERLEDPAILQLLSDWTDEICCGLVSIIHMLNPSCMILGGGIMEQDFVFDAVNTKLYPQLMPAFRHVSLKKAQLGNRAGMLGAGCIAERRLL